MVELSTKSKAISSGALGAVIMIGCERNRNILRLRPRFSILKYGRLNLFLKKKITVSVIFSLSFNIYVY